MRLLDGMSQLYAAKGKKVVHLNLKKDNPKPEELLKFLLGPSGYLRAPAARKGKSFMVGYDEETYAELFR